MIEVTFSNEAGETFERIVNEILPGYTVRVTTADGKTTDCSVVSTNDEPEWLGTLLVRAIDYAGGNPVGLPFTIVAEAIHVY